MKYIMHTLTIIWLIFLFFSVNAKADEQADVFYTKKHIQQLIVEQANLQGVDPALALALAKVASNFNARAVSDKGAVGVMQIMPIIAEHLYAYNENDEDDEDDEKEIAEPTININLGIQFLTLLLQQYQPQLEIALSHYFGGAAVKNKWGQLHVMPSTRQKVNKVLMMRDEYVELAQQLSVKKTVSASLSSFEKSRYGKVEQLQKIRMHNILRNSDPESSYSEKDNSGKNKLKSTESVQSALKVSDSESIHINETLSVKRNKVLKWEAVFN